MNVYAISQKVNAVVNINKLTTIHPKTGKALSPFGHELNSTQGAIDLALLNASQNTSLQDILLAGIEKEVSQNTSLQDILLAGIEKEVSINRTEYGQDAHKKVRHTLSGHYARKAIDKGQGKLTYLGSKRESGQKAFKANFILCGGTAEQWEKLHGICSVFNNEAKALGKALKALCPPERHCTETNEVRMSIDDLKVKAYMSSRT